MFRISRDPITVEGVGEHSAAGAFVTFDGRVRDHNEGQAVLRLEYEAYDELAVSEGERILEEARQRFDVLGIECVHRVGLLEIGDVAVRVGVAAAHRGEAFRACEFVIDEVKRRVPIWKKEYYASGASDWINCHSGEAAMEAEAAYYARQVRLPDLGQEGQSKLKAARVLVVGAGGLGSSALLYLAASGVGKIGISEDDVLSPSNLHRQVLYNWADVGKPKAALAARRLLALNPFVTAEVHARITTDNALAIFQDYDLVLDCTDNFRSKFLLSDAAVAARKPLVQASIYQYEGQLHVYDPKVNSPCLRCTWPEIPAEDCVGSCAEVGVMGVLPGVFGALQASEAIKLILRIGESPVRKLILFDLLTGSLTTLERERNPRCPACGESGRLFTGGSEWEVEASQIPAGRLQDMVLVDIREGWEQEEDPFGDESVLRIPMGSFQPDLLPGGRDYLLVCHLGGRSGRLARALHDHGYTNFVSLIGGAEAARRLLSRAGIRRRADATAGEVGHPPEA